MRPFVADWQPNDVGFLRSFTVDIAHLLLHTFV
jgi:hypothetical protein